MQDPPPPSVWHNIKYVYCSYCCSVGDDFKVCKNTRLQLADDICAAFPSRSVSNPCGCTYSPLVVDGNIINIPFILKLQQYEQQISNLQRCHTAGFWHLCSVPILIQTCTSVPSVSFCTSVPCQINRTLLHPMKSWCAFITSPTPLGMAALCKSPVLPFAFRLQPHSLHWKQCKLQCDIYWPVCFLYKLWTVDVFAKLIW